MSERDDTHDPNMELARRIENDLFYDPNSAYAGKWIGIANGEVVVVAETFDDAEERLREVEPDSSRRLLMEGVGRDEEGVLASYGELLCPERGRGCPLTPPAGPFPHGSTAGLPMSPPNDVYEINSKLARKINQEARRDPKSPYAGKFVGIANGQVVVVSDNWDDLARRLRVIEPDPLRTYCIEASADYDSVYEV